MARENFKELVKRTFLWSLAGAAAIGTYFSPMNLKADTHYVSKDNTNSFYPYTNWNTAAQNIPGAVLAASGNDNILVSNGTYYITETPISISNNITLASVNGRDETIIDGLIASGFNSGAKLNNSKIKGFTIRNFDSAERGSALYLDNHSKAEDCTITDNSAYNIGGGVYAFGESGLENCLIENNSARYGGGAYFYKAGDVSNCIFRANTATITGGGYYGYKTTNILSDCTFLYNKGSKAGGAYFDTAGKTTKSRFKGNIATDNPGGGIYVNAGIINPAVSSCIFEDNTASNNTGGAIHIESQGDIENCLIVNNSAGTHGGGISIANTWPVSSINIRGCTIASNSADSGGGVYGGGNFMLFDTIIFFNSSTNEGWNNYHITRSATVPDKYRAYYSDSTPEFVFWHPITNFVLYGWEFGSITNNPDFVDGTYYLNASSPCIDRAMPSSTNTFDLFGIMKNLDGNGDGVGLPDIGCFEGKEGAERDNDNDGLSNDDEIEFGGNIFLADSEIDYDGDGHNGLQEYIAGTDNLDFESVFKTSIISSDYGLSVVLHPTSSKRGYYIEGVENLQNSTTSNSWTRETEDFLGNGSNLEVIVSDSPQRFFRARVFVP